jgi:hypothetical protein
MQIADWKWKFHKNFRISPAVNIFESTVSQPAVGFKIPDIRRKKRRRWIQKASIYAQMSSNIK